MITFEKSILITIILKKLGKSESRIDITTLSKESFKIGEWERLLYDNGNVYILDQPKVKKRIILECHDAPSTGHPRIHRTLILTSTQLFWPKMHLNKHKYVSKFHRYHITKLSNFKPLDFYIPWRFRTINGKVYPWILWLPLLASKKSMMPFGL